MLRFTTVLTLASAFSLIGGLASADSITKPHTFASGDTIKSSEVNANFDTVYGQVNKIGSVFYIDQTKKHIGIGEPPEAPLNINVAYTGPDQKGFVAYSMLGNLQTGRLSVGTVIGSLDASPVLIPRSSNQDIVFSTFVASTPIERVRIRNNGNVGIGKTPSYPLHMASDAYVTTGGVWTNASSREFKENILNLSAADAQTTLAKLNPVTFAYKKDPAEKHVGFIAEDVPDLLATQDRKGLSAMDVVAVVTKVVQEQQETIKKQSNEIQELRSMLQKTLAGIASLKQEVNHLKSERGNAALHPISY
ncbi:MAG: tail fiber domain-containing protein [Magnetococcus sp. DMHC-1]